MNAPFPSSTSYFSASPSSISQEENSELPYLIKFAILGDTMTGKTSLIHRFLSDRVSMHYTATTSLQISQKTIQLAETKSCIIELWDVPGLLLTSPGIYNVLAQVDAVFLVYDVTQPCTLKTLDRWIELVNQLFPETVVSEKEKANLKTTSSSSTSGTQQRGNMPGSRTNLIEVKKYRPDRRHPPIALLGNKMDLTPYRLVPPSQHYQFAEQNDVYSYFVSVKQPETVFTAILGMMNEVFGQLQEFNQVKGLAKRLSEAHINLSSGVSNAIKPKRALVLKGCQVQ